MRGGSTATTARSASAAARGETIAGFLGRSVAIDGCFLKHLRERKRVVVGGGAGSWSPRHGHRVAPRGYIVSGQQVRPLVVEDSEDYGPYFVVDRRNVDKAEDDVSGDDRVLRRAHKGAQANA